MAKEIKKTPKQTKAIFDQMVKAFVAPKPKPDIKKKNKNGAK